MSVDGRVSKPTSRCDSRGSKGDSRQKGRGWFYYHGTMDDQSSDSTLEPAQQWNCTLQSVKSNQINHVKSLRAMTKALTQKQNKTQIEIGCRLFLLVRLPKIS